MGSTVTVHCPIDLRDYVTYNDNEHKRVLGVLFVSIVAAYLSSTFSNETVPGSCSVKKVPMFQNMTSIDLCYVPELSCLADVNFVLTFIVE